MKRILLSSLFASALVGACFYFYYSLPQVTVLRGRNPKSSALMELRDQEYRQKNIRVARRQIWVPYEAISDHLKKAVLVNEDAAFFSHKGIDVDELEAALRKDWETKSFNRGGSTITMQLARNLYLSPSKNPLRKLKEIVIAWELEQALSKKRIFEIYLNIVEWGRNIYGAEAAARFYFGKSAAALDPVEAATLAALLPSPRTSKERNVLNRRNLILARLASVGYISNEEYQRAKKTPLFKNVEDQAPDLPADE